MILDIFINYNVPSGVYNPGDSNFIKHLSEYIYNFRVLHKNFDKSNIHILIILDSAGLYHLF